MAFSPLRALSDINLDSKVIYNSRTSGGILCRCPRAFESSFGVDEPKHQVRSLLYSNWEYGF